MNKDDMVDELMERIENLIKTELLKSYDLDFWRETTFLIDENKSDEINDKWNLFNKVFKLGRMTHNVQASLDEWAPCLVIEFEVEFKFDNIKFRLTLVKNEIQSLQLLDMMNAIERIPKGTDLLSEFDNILTLHKLITIN